MTLALLLLAARLLPIALLVPVLGPVRAPALRMGIALVVAFTLAFVRIPESILFDMAHWTGHDDFMIAIAVAKNTEFEAMLLAEIAIGAVLSFTLAVPFYAAWTAGGLMDRVYRPAPDNSDRSGLGTFTFLLAAVVFFGIDGHTLLLRAVAASYRAVPIGAWGVAASGHGGDWGSIASSLIAATAHLMAASVAIAAPFLAAGVVVDLAVAAVSRAHLRLAREGPDSSVRAVVLVAFLCLALPSIVVALAGESGDIFWRLQTMLDGPVGSL